jgi:ssDNA-binding Zn-finger/Zn-ribbon topoisomerase 1
MAEIINITSKSGKYYKGGGGGYHYLGGICPSCESASSVREKGTLVERKNKNNDNLFLGCSRYPECKYTYPLYNPREIDESKCPICHGTGVLEETWGIDELCPECDLNNNYNN